MQLRGGTFGPNADGVIERRWGHCSQLDARWKPPVSRGKNKGNAGIAASAAPNQSALETSESGVALAW